MTRIKKEIRELLERKTVLPSRGQTKKDKQLLRALSVLRSNSYECNKCGANMVLRDGPNLPFWGCSTFPACWGKKHLTKDELVAEMVASKLGTEAFFKGLKEDNLITMVTGVRERDSKITDGERIIAASSKKEETKKNITTVNDLVNKKKVEVVK